MGGLHKLVNPWLLDADSDDLLKLLKRLAWLEKRLFLEYEPDLRRTFDDRVTDWLENVDDGPDRKLMFRLLSHLFFIGKPQFNALCEAAYNDHVVRWIVDLQGIDLLDPLLSQKLSAAVNRTWFCPITDSMRISSFLKVNRLRGHDIRGDFRAHASLGDAGRIQRYVAKEGIQGLALLEDFVGSGNQMRATIEWAALTLPATPILLAPLVCCPEGVKVGNALASQFANVSFAPTLALSPTLFLLPQPQRGEPELFGDARALVQRLKDRMNKWGRQPFGYEDTGAIVALFTNCPDNTLAIVHDSGKTWKALFPRIQRG